MSPVAQVVCCLSIELIIINYRQFAIDPQIKYFETACVTDNAVEAVLLPDAAE
jgi:hypothetical protein